MPMQLSGSPVISTQARQTPHSASPAHAVASSQQFIFAHSIHGSPCGSGVQSSMPEPVEAVVLLVVVAAVVVPDVVVPVVVLVVVVPLPDEDFVEEVVPLVVVEPLPPAPPEPESSPQPATSAPSAINEIKQAFVIAITSVFFERLTAIVSRSTMLVHPLPSIAHRS